MIRLASGLLLAAVLLAAGCGASVKQVALQATIASVETVDEGIAAFTSYALDEEHKIAVAAIGACQGEPSRTAFLSCTDASAAPRRAKLDRVKAAIRVYQHVLTTGADAAGGAYLSAAGALVEALGEVGVKVTLPIAGVRS